MNNIISAEYAKETCKIGQGADCCRYLTVGGNGFECQKMTSLKKILDARVKLNMMVVKGDNCPGKGEIITEEIHPQLGKMKVVTIKGGDSVICDMCGDDYSKLDDQGGILFGGKACCPKCTPDMLESAKKHGELHHVKDRALKGESFKNFVFRIRQSY